MDVPVYLVQCMSGHVMEVILDTELEQKCKDREAKGFLDALCLGHNECPDCIEESRERASRNANTCADSFCPFTPFGDDEDPCAATCQFGREYRAIKDSPHNDQLRGLPVDVQ